VRRRFPMNGHRVVPHMWRPRTMVTPSCDVGRSRLYGTLPHLCPLNRGTPLDAPPPQGERRVEPCVLEFRPSSRGFPLLVDVRVSPSPSTPQRPMLGPCLCIAGAGRSLVGPHRRVSVPSTVHRATLVCEPTFLPSIESSCRDIVRRCGLVRRTPASNLCATL
jgi:hypothetical protein